MKKGIIGIYIIKLKTNKYFYIGQSNDIARRWANHKTQLNHGTHSNVFLQSIWNKYGSDNFDFVIVEQLENDRVLLNNRETYWLEFYKKEYGEQAAVNLHSTGGGHNMSDSLKQKLRLKHEGLTPWNKGKKCPQLSGKNNGNYGKKLTPENKQKLQEGARKARLDPEKAKRMNSGLSSLGDIPWNKGKKVPQTSGSNNYNARPVQKYSLDNVLLCEYPTSKEGSLDTGVPRSNICKCCRGQRKSAGGYIWKYKTME